MRRITYLVSHFAIILMLVAPVLSQDKCSSLSCVEWEGHASDIQSVSPVSGVRRLNPETWMVGDRTYSHVNHSADIYDAPDGSIIGYLDGNFAFITPVRSQANWTEINPNQWILSSNLEAVSPSPFSGILLSQLPLSPLAWVLEDSWLRLLPGSEEVDQSPFVSRYSLVQIHRLTSSDGLDWYHVGPGWLQDGQLARVVFLERPSAIATFRWIAVDLDEQVAVAYEGNRPAFATLISSGSLQRQTGVGVFHIYARYKRVTLNGADGLPDQYYLEEVPWMMYFDDNIGFHGAYWHDSFGYPVSHGCVNLSLADANWLYHWSLGGTDWASEQDLGVAVYVFHSSQLY